MSEIVSIEISRAHALTLLGLLRAKMEEVETESRRRELAVSQEFLDFYEAVVAELDAKTN